MTTAIIIPDASFSEPSLVTLPDWDVALGQHAHMRTWLVPDQTRCTLVSDAAAAVADRKSAGPGWTQSNALRRPAWVAPVSGSRPALLFDGTTDQLLGGNVVPISADVSFCALVKPTNALNTNNRYILFAGSTAGRVALYQGSDGRFAMYVGGGSDICRALSPSALAVAGQTYLLIGSYDHAAKTARLSINQSATYNGGADTGTVTAITSGVLRAGTDADGNFCFPGTILDSAAFDVNLHAEPELLETYVSYINGRYGLSMSTTAP